MMVYGSPIWLSNCVAQESMLWTDPGPLSKSWNCSTSSFMSVPPCRRYANLANMFVICLTWRWPSFVKMSNRHQLKVETTEMVCFESVATTAKTLESSQTGAISSLRLHQFGIWTFTLMLIYRCIRMQIKRTASRCFAVFCKLYEASDTPYSRICFRHLWLPSSPVVSTTEMLSWWVIWSASTTVVYSDCFGPINLFYLPRSDHKRMHWLGVREQTEFKFTMFYDLAPRYLSNEIHRVTDIT